MNILLERLISLEPEKPEAISDPPFYNEPLPTRVFQISEVINQNQTINFDVTYNKK